jgi:hypothetical protein
MSNVWSHGSNCQTQAEQLRETRCCCSILSISYLLSPLQHSIASMFNYAKGLSCADHYLSRHWAVFAAGSIMMMVFWIIPASVRDLQHWDNNPFHVAEMGTSASLVPIDQQEDFLNAKFLNTAYGITWLNQRLPPFTGNDFAVLPFRPSQSHDESMPSSTETWSTRADAFSTNLTCSPAKVLLESTGSSYTFDNGKGCSVSQISFAETSEDFLLLYIGYLDNAQDDWALQNPDFPAEFSNLFLAIFAATTSLVQTGVYSNMTALFCETSYSSQNVYVNANALTNGIYQFSDASFVDQNAPATELDDLFNTTNFEYILGAGVSPSTGQRSNFEDIVILEQYPRVQNYNVAFPVTSMVGFAVGLSQSPVGEFTDPATLQQAFQKAHQVLFISAFSALSTPLPDANLMDLRDGLIHDFPGAIILVRPIALAVEVAFGIIIVLTMSLWYFSNRRLSKLCTDPASIRDIMSLMETESNSQDMFGDDGKLTADALAERLSVSPFYLERGTVATQSSDAQHW